MKPRKTRRVLVCALCGHESQPLGTANSIDGENMDRRAKEMHRHIQEKHADEPKVHESLLNEELGTLLLMPFYSLEIRRNPL